MKEEETKETCIGIAAVQIYDSPVVQLEPTKSTCCWDDTYIRFTFDSDIPGVPPSFSLSWKEISGLDLAFEGTRTCSFRLLVEPRVARRGFILPSRSIPYFSFSFASVHLQTVVAAINEHELNHLLKHGIPRWMRSWPYNKFYNRRLRRLASQVVRWLDMFLIVCFLYQLTLYLPESFQLGLDMQSQLSHYIYTHVIDPAWNYSSEHPYIAGAIGAVFLLFFWPLLLVWWGFILGGVALLRFSFLIYLIVTVLSYTPVVVSRFKRFRQMFALTSAVGLWFWLFFSRLTLRKRRPSQAHPTPSADKHRTNRQSG
ncbi:hypothetical protein QOT17_004971 [Balamuthia mandrillaris]